MKQSLTDLHPNPGWRGTESGHPDSDLTTAATDMVGKHCILELYDCDPNKLNDEAFLRTTITNAAKRAGATLLNLITIGSNPKASPVLHSSRSPTSRFTPGLKTAMPQWMFSPVAITPCLSRPAR